MNMIVLDAKTMGFPESEWEEVRALGNLRLHDVTPYDAPAIAERIADAEVVLTNKVPLPAEVIAGAGRLRLISVLATGYNIVDLESARERGVTVCNVPGYGAESVAQHTIALLLELRNHVARHNASVQAGDWIVSDTFSYWQVPLHELRGQTMGIVGFGDIGRRVGAIAHAFGMRILAAARTRRDAPDWKDFAWAETDEIFESADVVSLHCPATPETIGLVNAGRLARMQGHAQLINTARGNLVVEEDLAEALRSGRPAAAGLDVLQHEPMDPACPLRSAPNCIITPHMAWATVESRRRLLQATVENIRGFLDGRAVNVVEA